jgi:hypothetical protein
MNENSQFENNIQRNSKYENLARWLQHVFVLPEQASGKTVAEDDANMSELVSLGDYHPHFYQQLPDFILSLLHNDASTTTQYAPLLYHLAMCDPCREAYCELYDALGYALTISEAANINQGTRPLASIAATALVQLCQLWITQAEAVLRLARHEHTDRQAEARSLLQMAMRVSAQITQSSLRVKALQDLVKVATLTENVVDTVPQTPATRSYAPLIGAGGTRHGNVMRKADTATRSSDASNLPTEPPTIYLQSHLLEGSITQKEDIIELHLHDLDETLRGHYIAISVPLGSLIEPVHWIGGNPKAIRSALPVSQDGTLITPLGATDLRLNNTDERNLLEVMFLLLEVRPTS